MEVAKMSENNDEARVSADDVVVSWRDRIAKRGAALADHTVDIDVRQSGGRPPPPDRLSADEGRTVAAACFQSPARMVFGKRNDLGNLRDHDPAGSAD
jgi:hypothetical protein